MKTQLTGVGHCAIVWEKFEELEKQIGRVTIYKKVFRRVSLHNLCVNENSLLAANSEDKTNITFLFAKGLSVLSKVYLKEGRMSLKFAQESDNLIKEFRKL